VKAYAELYDLELAEVIVDAGESAKSLDRPGLKRALGMLKAGEAEALLVVKLDRLTRSVVDLGTLVERYTTELVTGSGKLYLAAVLDLYSRFVVGWAVSAVNDRHLTLKALEMGLKRRCPGAGLLHHSDQGSTYASEDYQRAPSSTAEHQGRCRRRDPRSRGPAA